MAPARDAPVPVTALFYLERTYRMLIVDLLAAGTQAAPQNKFGFAEALEQGGFIAYATVVILGVMSFGSFYILFTKLISMLVERSNSNFITFCSSSCLAPGLCLPLDEGGFGFTFCSMETNLTEGLCRYKLPNSDACSRTLPVPTSSSSSTLSRSAAPWPLLNRSLT